nr:tetratricopeptide repeat protein [Gemmatimonadales bacterium]
AIQQIETGADTSPDLSLYNRVGDLYLKTNDTTAAVRSYERAVDLYADQGFFNNAIALCGKILRVNPGRTQTYLKLAQLHARKNVVIEAKRNLIEFLERMNALGQLDQAFGSVKEFADQFSGSQEIRMMLVELLRATSREDEAREQLEKLAGQIESRGERAAAPRPEPSSARPADATPEQRLRPAPQMAGLVFLDTGVDLPAAPPERGGEPGPVTAEPAEGLLVSQLPIVPDAHLPGLPGLETTAELELEITGAGDTNDLGLDRVEPVDLGFEGVPLVGIDEPLSSDDGLLDGSDQELTVSLEQAPYETEAANDDLDLDLVDPQPPTTGLPLIQVDAPAGSIAELENRVLDDPDDPELHRHLADALLASGQETRALEELELALVGYEGLENWGSAAQLANRLAHLAPDDVRYHQKRVELAYRMGDRAPLLDAYLSLGDALARMGAREKAMAVYGRVLEHDSDNAHAAAALSALTARPETPAEPRRGTPPAVQRAAPQQPETRSPEPAQADAPVSPSPPPRAAPQVSGGAFVDLGSMILEGDGPRDTRMRIERREPEDEDEQREFKEILDQFKRGIEQNLDSEDYEAHYDLGIAFKEMGLLDEAIAEFQKALRAPDGRLRTSEALGQCFFEKGQHAIAESVLRRAVESIEGGDEAKIGLIYWLGRAAEAQSKDAAAIANYERAMAVDIRFMDLGERIHRLTAGPRE